MTALRDRSSLPEVRNPVLKLDSTAKLQALPSEVRELLYDLLMELSVKAKAMAEGELRRSKWWMAAYWHCVKVYSKHIARAIRRGRPE